MIAAIAGCAERRQSSAQTQNQVTAAKLARQPVEGLCGPPDVPSADLAHRPGYRQFAVSVTSASGLPVSGLKQADFVVSEESQKVPIDYFRERAPVAIALLVDTSGSMEPKLAMVKLRLGNLVENLNRCDEVMLFGFSTKPDLVQSFTTDHQIVATQMEGLHAYGQTALYDVTNAALQSLEDADYPNRTIILITDGMDNTSTATREEVAAQARKHGVPIYSIGIGDPTEPEGRISVAIGPFTVDESERVDAESLKAFSAAAGGRTFIVPGTAADAGNGFMTALSVIADTIARGYAIGVVIPENVTLSAVKLTIQNRPDLVLQTHLITANP
jgi:Ca-activated chloride channel family protein